MHKLVSHLTHHSRSTRADTDGSNGAVSTAYPLRFETAGNIGKEDQNPLRTEISAVFGSLELSKLRLPEVRPLS